MIVFENKENINDNRQYNLDLCKAIGIICMIICHSVLMLGIHKNGYENDWEYMFGDDILGDYIFVAHGFMLAMGFGIVYSRKNDSLRLIKRGIILFLLAYVLNFLRYGFLALIYAAIENDFNADTRYALLSLDIFHFAGIALIFTGLLKKLKIKPILYAVIGLIFSIISYFLSFITKGNFTIEYIFGFFIPTEESAFPFLNYYLFVGIGIYFGSILININDKYRFYKWLLIISFPIMVIYIILTCIYGIMFLSKHNSYYGLGTLDAFGLLSIDFVLLSLFHFLINKTGHEIYKPFISMSKNITIIYFVQWILIGLTDVIFCYLLEIVFPYWFMYLYGIIIVFVSYYLSKLKIFHKKKIK